MTQTKKFERKVSPREVKMNYDCHLIGSRRVRVETCGLFIFLLISASIAAETANEEAKEVNSKFESLRLKPFALSNVLLVANSPDPLISIASERAPESSQIAATSESLQSDESRSEGDTGRSEPEAADLAQSDQDQIEQENQHLSSSSSSIEKVMPVKRPKKKGDNNNKRSFTDQSLVQSANKRMPPIYKSAPKQIDALAELMPKNRKESLVVEVEKPVAAKKSADLHTAADGYYEAQPSHKKKKRKYTMRKKKPKYKKKKRKHYYPKKKKKEPKHYEAPSYGGHHEASEHGHYYEYRSVPKKGAWKFGYKRGNKKHTIERKEHGHKSHFKTEVKWKDKKGKGHHVFDYNHHDKKKHHGGYHHAAAASASKASKAPKKPAA